MLEADGVTVRFGDRVVLDEVGLTVGAGEVVGLLGPSGSGKSTLLRVIAGLLVPDHGRVAWDGEDLRTVPTHRRRFGLVFQDHQLFPQGRRPQRRLRTFRGRATQADPSRCRCWTWSAPGRAPRRGAFSGGEPKRRALALPRLLLLDERSALDHGSTVARPPPLKELGIAGCTCDPRPRRGRHRRRPSISSTSSGAERSPLPPDAGVASSAG